MSEKNAYTIEEAHTLDELETLIRWHMDDRGMDWSRQLFDIIIQQPAVVILVGQIAAAFCDRDRSLSRDDWRDSVLTDIWDKRLSKFRFPPPPKYSFRSWFRGFIYYCFRRFYRDEVRSRWEQHGVQTDTDAVAAHAKRERVLTECTWDQMEDIRWEVAERMEGEKRDMMQMMLANPTVKKQDIAEKFKVTPSRFSQIAKEYCRLVEEEIRAMAEMIK